MGVGNTVVASATGGFEQGVSYVVDIVHLTKTFKRRTRASSSYTTFKATLLTLLKGRRKASRGEEALTTGIKNLTLRIPKGASVGLIGRNGSGKSSFLKLLTGIYKPTSGTVRVTGRIAALIELGAGFHPDFTGRENLMLSGILHGLSHEEIRERFDEIVKFAELEDVIDDPVRTYSSGMFMRLGFSIAIHTDPDILLIDEVLAVGDAGFVAKCKDRIAELRKAGKTLVLVTHDLDAVERWCDEVIWIHHGEVMDRGNPRRVIDAYRHFVEKQEELDRLAIVDSDSTPAPDESSKITDRKRDRWGSREVEITGVEVLGSDGSVRRVFHPDDSARLRVSYRVNGEFSDPVFGFGINRADGISVYGTNTHIDRVSVPNLLPAGSVECQIDRIGLVEGSYTLDVAAHRVDGYPYDFQQGVIEFSVRSERSEVGVVSLPHGWTIDGTAV
jgi:lipopolysaccharide transport system ATP-binding protein